jgi:hypothetical protein
VDLEPPAMRCEQAEAKRWSQQRAARHADQEDAFFG